MRSGRIPGGGRELPRRLRQSVLAVLLLCGCGTDIEGVPRDAYDVVIRHGHFGGGVGIAHLRREALIQGIRCRGGTDVGFDADGHLVKATLAAEHRFGPLQLPAGSSVWLTSGRLDQFKTPQGGIIDGITYGAHRIGVDAEGHIDRAWDAIYDFPIFHRRKGTTCCPNELPMADVTRVVATEANRLVTTALHEISEGRPVVWPPDRTECVWEFHVEFASVTDTLALVSVHACTGSILTSEISGAF